MEDSLPSRVQRGSRNVVAAETFVGREEEFATLRAAVDALASGQGSTWLLSGEPGIGKTRFCEELRGYARERGVEVLFARCHQGEGSPPFWPWVQAFRAFARERTTEELRAQLGSDREDVAQLVPELREQGARLSDSLPRDEPEARFRQFDSVASVLRRASTAKPLMLVLDDLHWADPPSVRLLSFLTRNASDAPLLLVGTLRDVGVVLDPALASALAELEPQSETLALGGLSAGEVSRFVESATREVPPTTLVGRLHTETGGNPLFLGEFVKLLASQGGFE
ncbi:MAG: DUF2791 family P-loop domain-containing protein, partial [Myxococcales bacterium]|nr:DUF2791 family P-loop domain-containing protein [Myxococcales bacterium]